MGASRLRVKAYCAIWVRRSNFSPPGVSTRVTTREHPAAEGGTVGEKFPGNFCLNADLHVSFRDLLHAVKLLYGTDGFTSPPKESVLRIFFFALKIRRVRTRELGYQKLAKPLSLT